MRQLVRNLQTQGHPDLVLFKELFLEQKKLIADVLPRLRNPKLKGVAPIHIVDTRIIEDLVAVRYKDLEAQHYCNRDVLVRKGTDLKKLFVFDSEFKEYLSKFPPCSFCKANYN